MVPWYILQAGRAGRSRDPVREPPRKYICWNCGSPDHRISDCTNEIRQENKTFWRKYFRRYDQKEKIRHRQRYANFLEVNWIFAESEMEQNSCVHPGLYWV